MIFFELVGVLKELGYTEIDTIYYKDHTTGMNVLVNEREHFRIVIGWRLR